MKNLLISLSIVAAAFAMPLAVCSQSTPPNTSISLPTYNAKTLLAGGTNNVAATATNTYATSATTFNLQQYSSVGVQVSLYPLSTSTGTISLLFAESLDGVKYETVPSHLATFTMTALTTNVYVTNFTIPASGWIQLKSVGNTNAMAISNLTVTVSGKAPRAPL